MKRLFYGWYMVAAGSGLQVLQSGLMTQSFGAYLAVLQVERGWSKTALSGAAALQQMEAAILGPVLGWFIDRFGPQGMIRAGIVVFGIGLMLLSFTDTLLAFYGAFVVIALGASLCGFFPVNVALIHWFERWRARALSSLSLGIAAGGVVAADLRLARHRLRLRHHRHRPGPAACHGFQAPSGRPRDGCRRNCFTLCGRKAPH
jgi:MFS family permease